MSSYAERHKAKYAGKGASPRPVLVAGVPALRTASRNAVVLIDPRIAPHVAGLEADLLRLKAVPTRDAKTALKRTELLPRYLPLVQALESNGTPADLQAAGRIVFYCLVWSLDVHDWRVAIDLAQLMGKHGISSYDDFSRTPVNIVAGQMASWCNERHSDIRFAVGGVTAEPALSWLLEFANRHTRTLLEPILADIAKAQGGEAELSGALETALEHYRQALTFNPNAGVKRNITRLEKQLATPVATVPDQPEQGEQVATSA